MIDETAYEHCTLCPRQCRVMRTQGIPGMCGETAELRIARAALHFWEEPPISGTAGSGTIFFSGCPLRCVYCQNLDISQGGTGVPITTSRLAQIMLELKEQGALNINLVTPLHFAPHIYKAVMMARAAGMNLPIVCNTSGYEALSSLRAIEDVIDIWLTDFKYASHELAGRLSAACDYPEVASKALAEMRDQLIRKGGRAEDPDGRMTRGIIVRHLVLPGHSDDSCAVLDRVWQLCANNCDLSVMNQYTPNAHCLKYGGQLARSITDSEYDYVLDHADDLGFTRLWWQQGGSVSESFIPSFDMTGVRGPELGVPK